MKKPFIIGVDMRDLKAAKTGTRTYLAEICMEFKNMQGGCLQFEFLDTTGAVYTGHNKPLKWLEHLRYHSWKQIVLPLKAWAKKCDVILCTDNFAPLLHFGYQTVPVFHDAFFFETPQNYGKLWLWLFKKTALPAARRSPFVITPTNYSKKQLCHFTGISPQKIKVILEGPRHHEKKEKQVELEALHLPVKSKKYLMHAGSFFKRKNIPALIETFGRLKATGYTELKLVLAGPIPVNQLENDYDAITEAIEKYGVKNDVIIAGYLPDNHLEALYKNALLYVFPSINEGFGLPVLEAFSHDLPVVVSNNTCLTEVGDNAVLSFDPLDKAAMFNTIKKVLDNEALRADMIAKGRERLKAFSWRQTAQQIVEVLKAAAEKN